MKIGLKCLHTCHISYVIWVCQHLFWSSSFTVEATLWLCVVTSSDDWDFAFSLFSFGLDLFVGDYCLIGCCVFDDVRHWRFGGAFLITR